MRYVLIFIGLMATTLSLKAQLQDSTSQVLFAKYLFDKGMYQYAAEEYERLHFLYPDNRYFLTSLFKAERFSGNLVSLERRIGSLAYSDATLSRNYFLTLVALDEIKTAENVLYKNLQHDTEPELDKFKVGLLLLKREEDAAQDSAKTWNINDEALYQLITTATSVKKKSPFVAGLMSALIPASGRFYAGDFKDGLFSLVFIAGTAFQSYNRFNKNGITSPGGWIYGGISFGFYLGNVWGSVKAAKRYNDQQYKKVYDETKHYFNTRFLD